MYNGDNIGSNMNFDSPSFFGSNVSGLYIRQGLFDVPHLNTSKDAKRRSSMSNKWIQNVNTKNTTTMKQEGYCSKYYSLMTAVENTSCFTALSHYFKYIWNDEFPVETIE